MKRTTSKTEKLNILALDIATHCGWAINAKVYGVWDLSIKRDESAGMRLIRFRSKLTEILEKENINLVVYERPAGLYKGAIIVQSELTGQLKILCEDKNIDYRAYSAKEIKTHATGKGNASKSMMIQAAKNKYNYTGNNDNEADAIWIWSLGHFNYKMEFGIFE